jgi:dCTP deaminase
MYAGTSRIDMSPGVLAKSQVERLFETGAITFNVFDKPDIDGSSFDLHLGRTAWQLTSGGRPATRELAKLKAKSSGIHPGSDAVGEYFLFEKKQIYLVELDHHLNLPPNINGRATGKSSIGRLDVITRLLTDNSSEYDIVEAGYSGPLYLLILPQTFSIKVRPGTSLNQLRLFSGPPHSSVITHLLIRDFGTPFWYVSHPTRSGEYRSWEELFPEHGKLLTGDPSLFDLTVDLSDPDCHYIFMATETADLDPVDLRKGKNSHDPTRYFTKASIEAEGGTHSVVLEQGSFYIMKSKERLYIPHDVAVEIIAISERVGDIRIHYAGFAHPGFGRYQDSAKRGTPLIFEVRATDMSTRLYDGSLLARIQLFRMSAETETAPSSYDRQELQLSNVFADWPMEEHNASN